MSDENVCRFHLFGHCKFGETCRKFHILNTCTNFPCLLDNCPSRHPPMCKFFAQFGKCKYNEACYYIHQNKNGEINKALEDLKHLEEEIEALKAHNTQISIILTIIDQIKENI